MLMNYRISVSSRTFHFKQPAATSRGVYHTRKSYFLTLTSDRVDGVRGVGECATLPDLSCDAVPHYEEILHRACRQLEAEGQLDVEALRPYPSILFGLETALAQWHAGGRAALFDTPFARAEEGIAINGLVWMGSLEQMYSRLQQKLAQGFRCVKLKVGALDFEKELELIRYIRMRFDKEQIELRLDANGGFTPEDALGKLEQLSAYAIHSIEQPIAKGQWQQMARLCRESPVPIALDEELIGINTLAEKAQMLDAIQPHYIILKPSLHGGMHGSEEWVQLAGQRNVQSWMTSALESNVGLNAIAHLAAKTYGPHITFSQGLGTGQLFTDNIDMPLQIRGEQLWYVADQPTK